MAGSSKTLKRRSIPTKLNPGKLAPMPGRPSAVIRKQLDWVVEAAHRIFADTLEIELALDEIGEGAGQQHRLAELFGQGFEPRSHVDGRTDDGEVEPGARPDIAVHDVADMNADAVIQRRTTAFFAILL